MPTDEATLLRLLTELFERHWAQIVFGPFVEGAAFEFTCSAPPRKIGLYDGYLTVDFGGPHFHLCIGEHRGSPSNPVSDAQAKHRRTGSAEFFRLLDPDGHPITWGLSLENGAGEQQCTFFFPNPFLTPEGRLAPGPDWNRLALWDDLLLRYAGRPPDPRDRSAPRFWHP